ncbi:MAG: hypothetical protein SGI92_20785 [Bryobacteraceae bacterium]|nr:hypothetical protein [Bryobacteraceae bacterium]
MRLAQWTPARAFSQFDIDKDPPRLEELRQILDANDPDLAAFRKRGGNPGAAAAASQVGGTEHRPRAH